MLKSYCTHDVIDMSPTIKDEDEVDWDKDLDPERIGVGSILCTEYKVKEASPRVLPYDQYRSYVPCCGNCRYYLVLDV